MAGKAPLLLAMVLFAIGASGLALTSAERSSWGPFQPRGQATPEQLVVVVDVSTPYAVPSLDELFASQPAHAIESFTAPETDSPAATEAAEPTPTPSPPLRVYGISADDGGVAAAAVSETPPPIRLVNVATDDEPGAAETPEATASPEVTATPSPEVTGTPEATPSPEVTSTPEATATPSPETSETPEATPEGD